MAARSKITAAMVQEMQTLRRSQWPISKIAKKLGISIGAVSQYLRQVTVPKDQLVIPGSLSQEIAGPEGWVEQENEAFWRGSSPKKLKSEAELIRFCGVDTSIWYVKKWGCRAWTVGMRGPDKNPVSAPQWSVWAEFSRLEEKYLQEAKKKLDENRKKWSPKFPRALIKKSRGEFLAVMGLVDVHIGKLCWGKETGMNYDLKIAEKVFEQAVQDLIYKAQGREISSWVMPLGNDFFHIDSYRNQTTSGTPVDTDGRYPAIFVTGVLAARNAILRMLTVAPVDVLWVPGNHDRHASYHLCREILLDFQNNPAVTVDCGPSARKYYRYGKNLLGFTHGHQEKPDRLPNIMAAECRDWGAAVSRDWYIGHSHVRRAWTTKPVQTFESCTVRVIKALTGTDAWHYEQGYIDDQQAAEVFFYHREEGYDGHIVARARFQKDAG